MTRLVLVSLAAISLAWAASAQAADAPSPAQFNLSAEGEVSATPDLATLTLGVTARGVTAAEALKRNRDQMNAAIAALKRAGVADRDIQTSDLSLSPQMDYAPNQPPKLTGYQATNRVSAVVRDIARTGAVVDAVTTAGANEISGVSFDISDRAHAEDGARRAAVKALMDKAQLYAAATGLHIVRLANLSEGGGEVFQPRREVMPMALMKSAGPTPVEAGELKLRVSISGVFEVAK